jgi:guanylate kinase
MQPIESDSPLLVIIGPSGSGKSSAIEALASRGIVEVTPSWTTRPPRNGEIKDSVEHRFVSETEFDKHQEQGFFLEVVQPFDLPFRYGLPALSKPADNKVPLIMLRANLLPLLAKHYSNFKAYQVEDEFSRVKDRLLKRQAAGEPQGSRLNDYELEINMGRQSAQRTFTNKSDIQTLVDQIEQAISNDFKPT